MLPPDLDDEPAVRSFEPVEDHGEALPRFGPETQRPEVGDQISHRHHCIEHGDIDVLALTGAVAVTQRREHTDGSEQCSTDVAERTDRRHHGRTTRLEFVVVDAAHGFGDRRVGRPSVVWGLDGVAESGDREVHDGGVDGGDVFVTESHTGECTALEVLAHDVELGGEVEDELTTFGRFEIDTDRTLVEVVAQIGGTDGASLGISDGRLRTPPEVAAFHALDLDDISTHARQQLCGVGECLHLLEGEDANAIERFAVLNGVGIGDCSEFHGADVTGRRRGDSRLRPG
ncbi:unannotated protein [freshwater metagenome]|uniref:Unannotated protein n=1 Tax=freshwater metagenome TaxID=449393 RepID=A0A6J5YJM6_9ZZZZ